MAVINYSATDAQDLAIITPLREKTRQYHVERSKYFKKRVTEISIEEMNQQLIARATGGMFLDLARNMESEQLVGYCLSSIDSERQGEILSIYIEPEYRRRHIGEMLMKRALDWMEKQGAQRKSLSIWAGNEEVVAFYRRFNFEVRSITMEQKETG